MTDNTPPSLHDFEHNEHMEMLSKYQENVGKLRDNFGTENQLKGHNFPNTVRQQLEIQLAARTRLNSFSPNRREVGLYLLEERVSR